MSGDGGGGWDARRVAVRVTALVLVVVALQYAVNLDPSSRLDHTWSHVTVDRASSPSGRPWRPIPPPAEEEREELSTHEPEVASAGDEETAGVANDGPLAGVALPPDGSDVFKTVKAGGTHAPRNERSCAEVRSDASRLGGEEGTGWRYDMRALRPHATEFMDNATTEWNYDSEMSRIRETMPPGWGGGAEPTQGMLPVPPRRCALVSSSGAMLRGRSGAEIDSDYDFVIRFNFAPRAGFKEYVGSRTDAWVFWTGAGSLDSFHKMYSGPARDPEAPPPPFGLVGGSRTHDIRAWAKSRKTRRSGYERLHLLGPEVKRLALALLCHFSNDMTVWNPNNADRRSGAVLTPSSGFLAVVWAVHVCERVTLFGFRQEDGDQFHYYIKKTDTGPADQAPNKNTLSNTDMDPSHWFRLEHDIVKWLHADGVVDLVL